VHQAKKILCGRMIYMKMLNLIPWFFAGWPVSCKSRKVNDQTTTNFLLFWRWYGPIKRWLQFSAVNSKTKESSIHGHSLNNCTENPWTVLGQLNRVIDSRTIFGETGPDWKILSFLD
jgi:hypothetical protein